MPTDNLFKPKVKNDDYLAPGNDVTHFLLEIVAMFFLVFVAAYGSFWFALVAVALLIVVLVVTGYDVYKYAVSPAFKGE
jgi:hypothetical protein